MVNFYILAGGYPSVIVTYLFNNETSSLSLVGQYPTGQNPSWIELSPFNRSVLYATNEVENGEGAVQSFTVSPTGVVSNAISTIGSGGSTPAHLYPLSNGKLTVMNYFGANGLIIDTTLDRLHFGASQAITFVGNPSHPHMAYEYKSELLVPDLGQDKIWRLRQNHHGSNYSIQGFISQPVGSGPRHIAITRNSLYTLHETTSTVTVQPFNPLAPNATSAITSSVSIVPSDAPSNASWAAAEILIPPTSSYFPKEYIYASNRNTGTPDPRGDTIVIISKSSSGKLSVVKQVYTGLNQVRGMKFSRDGLYLVAGSGAGRNGVAVFKRVDNGADLQLVARNTGHSRKITFVWL